MAIPSYGATEAKVPDIMDATVDLTETGSSLRRNGLRVLDILLTSYTELIANLAASRSPRSSNSQSTDRVMPGHPTEGRSSQTHS